MNIDLTNRVYKVGDKVYNGHTQLNVQEQRGRLFIKYKGKQRNIKDIPVLPQEKDDYVHSYVLGGGFIRFPCPAMDYWIMRHRRGRKISTTDYKNKFNITFKQQNK